MDTFEALVGIAQTILRVRQQWFIVAANGDEIQPSHTNIDVAVHDAGELLRLQPHEHGYLGRAIVELERRATPWCERSPIIP